MKSVIIYGLVAALSVLWPLAAWAEWQAVEKVQTYAIAGTSGAELYQSIGERGPLVGKVRVIAHTSFKLTWTRDYQRQGDGCVLVSAVPKLTITYRLPKPSQELSADINRHWATFVAGVEQHERVHGDFIKDMVKAIEVATVGLSMPGDPGCRKIRVELTNRLAGISREQRRRSLDFDRTELSEGGNIHQLILNLVNGE